MRRVRHLVALLALAGTAALAAVPAFGAGVTPQTVDVTLPAGGSTDVAKTVTTNKLPPASDFVFLADNTGSMGPSINDVKANASAIIAAIEAAGATDARYAVANYQDTTSNAPCPYTFQLNTNLTNAAGAQAAINSWKADQGCDLPESNLYALHKVATTVAWRPGSVRFVIWFGDAPGHDPVCAALPDVDTTVTEASATADLVAVGAHVIAASAASGPGLDADPHSGFDYVADCGPPGGAAGQAARITAATAGADLVNPPGSSISQLIINAINALPPIPLDVTPVATCDAGVTLTFTPPTQTVPSGSNANFNEHIQAGTAPGTYHCTVDFLINGAPAGPDYRESVTVTVQPGPPASVTLTPPTATNVAGEQHCVVAHVTDQFGNPVPGQTVNFTVTGANAAAGTGTSPSNGSGDVTFCYTGTHAGTDTITATVAGTSVTATATKVYRPGPPANLSVTPPSATNTVDQPHCITATVTDQFGNPTPGQQVTFTPSGGVGLTAQTTATGANGQAQYCFTQALPADITVTVTVGGTTLKGTATKKFVAPQSTPGCKVTNGGRIVAADGDKATFGGNAQAVSTTVAKGEEEYQDHGDATDINVHSITVDAVTCSRDGTSASIFGTATVNGAGSYGFRIDVKDLGEPGSSDRYRIRLSNGYDSGDQQLVGGNIQIH